jgi:hypothetical protein
MRAVSNSKDRWILVGILLTGAIALFAKAAEQPARAQ